jgi:hypothetical protein
VVPTVKKKEEARNKSNSFGILLSVVLWREEQKQCRETSQIPKNPRIRNHQFNIFNILPKTERQNSNMYWLATRNAVVSLPKWRSFALLLRAPFKCSSLGLSPPPL